jgi:hypothetical protein
MCRLAVGLFFAVWTSVGLAAEPYDVFGLKLDVRSARQVYVQGEFPNQLPAPYRIGAGVVITDVSDASHNDFAVLGKSMTEPKHDFYWIARDNWPIISRDGRLSLAPLLRFGSEGQTIEITPRRHSLRIQYRLDFN